jgi:outer membrane protein
MRLYILPLTLLLSLATIAQDTANKWSLRKAVDYAVANNLTVKQADIQRMYANIDLTQSKMTKLPTLSGNIGVGFSFGLSNNPATGTLESSNFFSTQVGVQSNYSLFNWFARKYNIESNKLNEQASRAGIEKAQNDISLSVANTFLQAMLSDENVRIAELQLNQSFEQLKNTNALVNAGTVPELNALQLQSQVSIDSANLIQARSNYRQAIIQLKALLNLPQDTAFQIIIPPVNMIPLEPLADLEPKLVYSLAIANQPLQRINGLRLQQAALQVKAARGSMYPELFAQAGLNTSYVNSNTIPSAFKVPFFRQFNNNFGQNIGLGLSFSIFNQYQARSQWNRAKVQVQQYQIQQLQDNAALQSDIYNAYELAITALQQYNSSVRQVAVFEQTLNIANKRNSAGLLNIIDLIIATNNLSRARFEMARNKYDYVFKMKVLEFYKGNGIKL